MALHTSLLMSGTGTRWLQLFVGLSLLIVLHEFGHYFFAKRFKTRVEKFYLFFDFLFPFAGVLNFPLFKKKVGETEYGLGWFPLGGYVKIAGMVDESMDTEELAAPPKPDEFRSKPAWQRLFIMLGGIIVNVLVAIIIYMVVFGIWGDTYLPVANAKYGIVTDSLGRTLGLEDGDKIISVNHQPAETFKQVLNGIIFEDASSVQVQRGGVEKDITFSKKAIHDILTISKGSFIGVGIPAVVDSVAPGTNAAAMNLQHGDSIVAINEQPMVFYSRFQETVRASKEQPISITVIRNGAPVKLQGKVSKEGTLGFFAYAPDRYLEYKHITYSPVQAVAKGFSYTYETLGSYIRQFKLFKVVKPSEGMGGIGSFSKLFKEEFHWDEFLMMVAFISIILAFMNLLPIPGLDGGYVIFLLYEIISRRKVSDKVMERATTVGLILLVVLMLYANGLDVLRGMHLLK